MLRWEWNDKIGKCIQHYNGATWEYNCYQGNAEIIIIYEHDNQYQMINFLSDSKHAKNCYTDDVYFDMYEFILYPETMSKKDLTTLSYDLLMMRAKVKYEFGHKKED